MSKVLLPNGHHLMTIPQVLRALEGVPRRRRSGFRVPFPRFAASLHWAAQSLDISSYWMPRRDVRHAAFRRFLTVAETAYNAPWRAWCFGFM